MHNNINRHLSYQQLRMYSNFHHFDHQNVDMNQLDHYKYTSNKMIEHLNDTFINKIESINFLFYQLQRDDKHDSLFLIGHKHNIHHVLIELNRLRRVKYFL